MSGAHPIAGAVVTVFSPGVGAVGGGSSNASGQVSFGIDNPGGSGILYAVAAGGDAGAGSNSAIKLMAVLGSAANYSAATRYTVNELTTTASVWALAQFTDAQGRVSGSAGSLGIAAITGANLADMGSGAPAAALQAGANAPDKLDTLGNILAACVASAGPGSAPCTGLFQAASSGATVPADTLAAARAVALQPASQVAALFALAAGSSAYTPALAAAPNDWTLSLNFTGGGLSEPTQSALDAQGNVWVANYNNAVSEFSPAGAALSPAAGFTGGGLEESFGIAVDAGGKIWVCNEQSPSGVNQGRGSITELNPDGSVASGTNGYAGGGLDFPDAIAIDAQGNVWAGNYGNSTLSAFSPAGVAQSPSTGYTGGGLEFPTGIAFDGAGMLWVADNGANQVSEFSSAGAAVSPATGFSGGGVNAPQSVAVDQGGNIWVSNYYRASVSELASTGAALSPTGGYTGGGLNSPGGVAVDGSGNVWVTNYNGASISELAGASSVAPGTLLSPSAGFLATALSQPFAPAIDSAGNLWTANFGNNSLTELVGVAAPVRTPLLGLPAAP
jgi:sugar lactone lactonase YvrE